ncbi:Pep3/Vps18/deep orange family-domain-containing protein [Flagelloscypha sp. PMI_526]|nr:Pep3/Vps18/deep orange family-domain-containing protein [Flagelloscypha sp. PMI_526]
MFDEFVEHVGTPMGKAGKGLPNVQFEGFEPSPYPPGDPRAQIDDDVEDPILDPSAAKAPVFDLRSVQFDFPADLISMAVSSDWVVMGLVTNTLVLIDLSHSEHVIKIQIPRPPNALNIYKLFVDPSGRHIIVTSTQGENWYLFRTWKKPRQLKGFKMVIESIAWNKAALLSTSHTATSTREILIGSRHGVLYEAVLNAEEDFFKSVERQLQPVFSLPEQQPITGVKFDFFPPGVSNKVLIIVTTPTRIYQFIGTPRNEEGKVFVGIFNSYQDATPKLSELPGNLETSSLSFYTPNAGQAGSLPSTLAWLTGPGVYHGTMNFTSNTDDFVDGASLLPYPHSSLVPDADQNEPPIALSSTEFHFLLLYKDRITAVCGLDEKPSFEEVVPMKPSERVQGMTSDPVRGTFWVYTSKSLFELDITNESRDVWSIFLELGQYDTALKYAKTASQRDHILSAQGDAYFKQGRFFQAAQCYAQCSISFEAVALKFIDAGERDPLRAYLISRLERTRKTDLTQRMMLATWLVEFYLSKCNELDDLVVSESISQDVESLKTEKSILEEDLRQFLDTYKSNLDPATIFELIQSHGRTDIYLHFATVIGDFTSVIEHWILEEEWLKAIDVINGQSDLDVYYRFSSVLLRNAPKDTVDSWLRQPALDPIRLIPALLQLQHRPRDPLSPNQAIRYLKHLIFEKEETSSTIHNLLITFYASSSYAQDDDGALLQYLSIVDPITEKPYYDLDYALRICKQAGKTQACVHIYSQMGLFENSVDLALEKGDVDLARINADKPEDDIQLRKKLWLKVARYVVQDKKEIKEAMRFLEHTDLIKIEDILPFFPDFVVIDDFKEEIASALQSYSNHIEDLKSEMDNATSTAESIKDDIAALKNRFVTVDAGEQCSVCNFTFSPCLHTFHADCLIGLVKEYRPAHVLRRIINLQTELMQGSTPTTLNGDVNPISQPSTPVPGVPKSAKHTLISAGFAPIQGGTKAAVGLGRGLLSAGDKLRDLIVPDALAAVVSAPVGWMPGMGGSRKGGPKKTIIGGKKAEKLVAELDDLLASSCPLCESVVAGLDKPFVKEGEDDTSWAL